MQANARRGADPSRALREEAPADGGAPAGQSAKGQASELAGGGDTFISDLFDRIDSSGDNGVSRDEVIAHLKRVGVKGGFLGMVHSGAADAFLEHLDTNGDENVTFTEFRQVAKSVLPADVFDEKGQVRPELIDEVYATIDANRDAKVSRGELHEAAKSQMPKGTSHKDTKADIGARLGLDALDFDRSGGISKAELLRAAQDAVRALQGG